MDLRRNLLRNGWITLLASLAFAAVLAIPGRAGAASTSWDYGLQTVPTTLYWGPLALTHGPSESFTDKIQFQTSFSFAASFIDNFTNFANFASLSATLWNTAGPVQVFAADPNSPFAPFSTISSIPSSMLSAGSYEVRLIGVTSASMTPNPWAESGGLVLAAIPEPETYAMMLAGLGLMGFVARRRKQGRLLA